MTSEEYAGSHLLSATRGNKIWTLKVILCKVVIKSTDFPYDFVLLEKRFLSWCSNNFQFSTPNLKYIIQMTVKDLNDLTYQAKVNLLKESLNYYLAKKKKEKNSLLPRWKRVWVKEDIRGRSTSLDNQKISGCIWIDYQLSL